MDEKTKRALRKVVEYLIDDEEANWNEMDQPDDHIYHEVAKLEEWLASDRREGINSGVRNNKPDVGR